jgi:hypothetical protein
MSNLGPGTYSDESKSAFPRRMTQSIKAEPSGTPLVKCRNVKGGGTFGMAQRDVHFSKYASLHSDLVRKGLL